MIESIVIVDDNCQDSFTKTYKKQSLVDVVHVINGSSNPQISLVCNKDKYIEHKVNALYTPLMAINKIIKDSVSSHILMELGSVIWYNDKVDILLKLFDNHERVSMTYSDFEFYQNNKLLREFQFPYDSRLLFSNNLPSLIALYKTQFLKENLIIMLLLKILL